MLVLTRTLSLDQRASGLLRALVALHRPPAPIQGRPRRQIQPRRRPTREHQPRGHVLHHQVPRAPGLVGRVGGFLRALSAALREAPRRPQGRPGENRRDGLPQVANSSRRPYRRHGVCVHFEQQAAPGLAVGREARPQEAPVLRGERADEDAQLPAAARHLPRPRAPAPQVLHPPQVSGTMASLVVLHVLLVYLAIFLGNWKQDATIFLNFSSMIFYSALYLIHLFCFVHKTYHRYVLTDAIRNETALTDSSGNMALAAAAEEAEAALVAKAAAEAAEEEQAALNALELDTTSSGSGAVEEVARGTEALNLAE